MKAMLILSLALSAGTQEAATANRADELLRESLRRNCPNDCDCLDCPLGSCDCGCGCSAKVKRIVVKDEILPPAPKADYKHDCGCGSLPCNCFGPGGCHCNEHRAENRQPAKWWQDHDGTWGLYRGRRLIGALDSRGRYHPYDADADRWLPVTALPLPLPQPQALAPAFRRASGGGSC